MKKLIAIAILLIATAAPAMAQTWYTANQVTFAWDAVAKVQPTDSENKYQVYTRNNVSDPGVKIGGEITATQLVVSFSAEGRYYLGVEAIRYPSGETVGIRSATKAWSNVAADAAGAIPFGVMFFAAPGGARSLKIIP